MIDPFLAFYTYGIHRKGGGWQYARPSENQPSPWGAWGGIKGRGITEKCIYEVVLLLKQKTARGSAVSFYYCFLNSLAKNPSFLGFSSV